MLSNILVFCTNLATIQIGYMFHGKPLYAAIAQRKEERQAQLQLHYGQPIPGLAGHSTNVIPGGYPPLYYTAPTGVVPQVPPRPGLMYQPLGVRGGWRASSFAAPTRPPFQVAPHQVVSPVSLAMSIVHSIM